MVPSLKEQPYKLVGTKSKLVTILHYSLNKNSCQFLPVLLFQNSYVKEFCTAVCAIRTHTHWQRHCNEQIKLAISLSHSILTPGQPVLPLTLQRPAGFIRLLTRLQQVLRRRCHEQQRTAVWWRISEEKKCQHSTLLSLTHGQQSQYHNQAMISG